MAPERARLKEGTMSDQERLTEDVEGEMKRKLASTEEELEDTEGQKKKGLAIDEDDLDDVEGHLRGKKA